MMSAATLARRNGLAEAFEREAAGARRVRWTPRQTVSVGEFDVFTSSGRSYREGYLAFRRGTLQVRHKGEPIILANLVSLSAPVPIIDMEEIVETCDDESLSLYRMATLLAHRWPREVETPLAYGNILYLDRIIKKPRSAAFDWAPHLRTLIKRMSDKHGALILLHAFPLEFEGSGELLNSPEFEARTYALCRLYQSNLGMKVLGGEVDRIGWMWRSTGYMPDLETDDSGSEALSK